MVGWMAIQAGFLVFWGVDVGAAFFRSGSVFVLLIRVCGRVQDDACRFLEKLDRRVAVVSHQVSPALPGVRVAF